MFPNRYFAATYFPDRYYPPGAEGDELVHGGTASAVVSPPPYRFDIEDDELAVAVALLADKM